MKNLSRMKKVLLGTSLAGTIIVAASFGTFAYFTSDPVEVGGEIENLELSLNFEEKEVSYDIVGEHGSTMETKVLAPGRKAIGEWLKLTNDSNEKTTFNLGYTFQLMKDNELIYPPEKVSLSQYRSAALLGNESLFAAKELDFIKEYFENPKEFVTDPDRMNLVTRRVTDPENMVTIGIVDKENVSEFLALFNVGEIDGLLFPDTIFFPDTLFFPDSTFLPSELSVNFFPDSTFDEIDKSETLFPDDYFLLDPKKDVYFKFGTQLKKDTGNDYQGLTLETKFRFGVSQTDLEIEEREPK